MLSYRFFRKEITLHKQRSSTIFIPDRTLSLYGPSLGSRLDGSVYLDSLREGVTLSHRSRHFTIIYLRIELLDKE